MQVRFYSHGMTKLRVSLSNTAQRMQVHAAERSLLLASVSCTPAVVNSDHGSKGVCTPATGYANVVSRPGLYNVRQCISELISWLGRRHSRSQHLRYARLTVIHSSTTKRPPYYQDCACSSTDSLRPGNLQSRTKRKPKLKVNVVSASGQLPVRRVD